MPVFEWRSTVPFSADEVYAWHLRPGAFERLSPPWQYTRVIERSGDVEHGGTLVFAYHNGPLRGRWVAVHRTSSPGAVSPTVSSTARSRSGSTPTPSSPRVAIAA